MSSNSFFGSLLVLVTMSTSALGTPPVLNATLHPNLSSQYLSTYVPDSSTTTLSRSFAGAGEHRLFFLFRFLENASPSDKLSRPVRIAVQVPDATGPVEITLGNLSSLKSNLWYAVSVPISLPASAANGTFGISVTAGTDRALINIDQLTARATGSNVPSGMQIDFEGSPLGTVTPPIPHLTLQLTGEAWIAENLYWQKVPSWYELNRVHVHTRLTPNWSERPEFWESFEAFNGMGARVLTRHVKSRSEGPWWPTAVPDSTATWRGPLPGNTAGNLVAKARENNMRFIGYHWMMTDRAIQKAYPAYCSKEPGPKVPGPMVPGPMVPGPMIPGPLVPGPLVDVNHYDLPDDCMLSVNTPYGGIVQRRLVELVRDVKVDGLYFDESTQADKGNFADTALFAARWGASAPFPTEKNYTDPQYRKLLEVYDLTLREFFSTVSTRTKPFNSQLAIVTSVASSPELEIPRRTTETISRFHLPKSEWHAPDRGWNRLFLAREMAVKPDKLTYKSFHFATLRDTVNGRPPHYWIYNPGHFPPTAPQSPSTAQMMAASAFVIAHGGIANVDIAENEIPLPQKSGNQVPAPVPPLKEVIAMGESMGRQLSGARPLRHFGVYYDEAMRDRIYAATLTFPNPASLSFSAATSRVWAEAFAPSVYIYEELMRRGYPVSVVTRGHVARNEIWDFKAIFLPSDVCSPDVCAGLQEYERKGGRLIYANRPLWNSGTSAQPPTPWKFGTTIERKEFLDELGSLLSVEFKDNLPVKIVGDNAAGLKAITYQAPGGATLIAITQSPHWLRDNCEEYANETSPSDNAETCYAAKLTYPPAAANVTLELSGNRIGTRQVSIFKDATADASTPNPVGVDASRIRVEVGDFVYMALVRIEP